MTSIPEGYLLVACTALLSAQAWAGAKTVTGVDFQLSTPHKEYCWTQPFYLRHQQDEFYKNLKEVKSEPATQYRRGRDIVVNYPDSTIVRVELMQDTPQLNPCVLLPKFDPAKLQFRVEWPSGSKIVPGKGRFAVSHLLSPQPWCENRCGSWWSYELRIDSQDVPLQSQLILTIEAEDGTELARYLGKLSTAKRLEQRPSTYHPIDW